AVWALPVAALSRRRSITLVLALHAALLVAAYEAGSARFADWIVREMVTAVAPIVTVVAFIALLAIDARPSPLFARVKGAITGEREREHGVRVGVGEHEAAAFGLRERTSERKPDSAPRIIT